MFIKTYLVGAHKNRLAKVILMSTYNIGFYEEISKIIPYHQIRTLSLLLLVPAHSQWLEESHGLQVAEEETSAYLMIIERNLLSNLHEHLCCGCS